MNIITKIIKDLNSLDSKSLCKRYWPILVSTFAVILAYSTYFDNGIKFEKLIHETNIVTFIKNITIKTGRSGHDTETRIGFFQNDKFYSVHEYDVVYKLPDLIKIEDTIDIYYLPYYETYWGTENRIFQLEKGNQKIILFSDFNNRTNMLFNGSLIVLFLLLLIQVYIINKSIKSEIHQ